jgi:glucokinase
MPPISLGIDLGGTNARAAVVDRDSGAILASHKEMHRSRTPEAVVEVVAEAVRQSLAAAGVDVAHVRGAGMGVAGQVLGRSGVVLNAPNLGWRDVPLGDLVARRLGLEVRIANDLSAAAWGERRFGAAKGLDDAALVFVGSGVGSGLILGGRLHEGHRGVAGELGHIKVRPLRATTSRRLCGCGQHSCLEAYTSGVNIAARVREELAAGSESAVTDLVGSDLARVTATAVDEAYGKGDAYARELWGEVGALLGTALANLVTLLNPARVILGGGVILGCPGLEAIVHRVFEEEVSRSAGACVTLDRAHLGDDAGVIGAALLE